MNNDEESWLGFTFRKMLCGTVAFAIAAPLGMVLIKRLSDGLAITIFMISWFLFYGIARLVTGRFLAETRKREQ